MNIDLQRLRSCRQDQACGVYDFYLISWTERRLRSGLRRRECGSTSAAGTVPPGSWHHCGGKTQKKYSVECFRRGSCECLSYEKKCKSEIENKDHRTLTRWRRTKYARLCKRLFSPFPTALLFERLESPLHAFRHCYRVWCGGDIWYKWILWVHCQPEVRRLEGMSTHWWTWWALMRGHQLQYSCPYSDHPNECQWWVDMSMPGMCSFCFLFLPSPPHIPST